MTIKVGKLQELLRKMTRLSRSIVLVMTMHLMMEVACMQLQMSWEIVEVMACHEHNEILSITPHNNKGHRYDHKWHDKEFQRTYWRRGYDAAVDSTMLNLGLQAINSSSNQWSTSNRTCTSYSHDAMGQIQNILETWSYVFMSWVRCCFIPFSSLIGALVYYL